MNEQRLQAYYQLIQELLSCEEEAEVNRVLEANAELLDAEFLRGVVAVAANRNQQGQKNIANWLMGLASRLSESLNLPLEVDSQAEATPISEEDIEVYWPFLLEVLQATAESEGDAQVVYPLLAANTDKLNDTFTRILQVWATRALAEAEADTAKFLAGVLGEFSNLIQQFPLGSKASNMELAITGYEIVATVFNRDADPEAWATLKNNLGTAYSNRIRGDKADNLEMAIAAYTASLEVRTRTAFPQDWAMTQNNLGNAYSDRIRGDKADNLEMAIAAYTASLEVRTRNAFPQQWAMTQNNLGNAYLYRIRGDKAENLEMAIAAYTASLEVRTRTAFPQDWAMTQNNLGIAYSDRIRGDKAENLEMAIAAYTASLEVRTRTAFPQQWASTQNNLGIAYRKRIREDKADNLEMAIAAYTASLEVYTRTAFPQDWAMTQNNLGIAYSDRIRGDKAENLEMAITAYTASLEVYTRTAFPQDWAMTQNNLGAAYSNRIRGDKADNLEMAIAAYTASLEVYTRTAFPQDWATTQNNLGNAYSDRIRGDKADNLEMAIAAYTASLEVYTRDAFPQQWEITKKNLDNVRSNKINFRPENIEQNITAYSSKLENLFQTGITFQDIGEIELAYTIYKSAIKHFEEILKKISDSEKKRDFSEDWNKLFMKMIEVCIEAGKYAESIEYIEQSKTRTLVELISKQNAFTPIEYKDLLSLVNDTTVIIQFYIFTDYFRYFIITVDQDQPEILTSEPEDLKKLKIWFYDNYLELYHKCKKEWSIQLSSQLAELSKIINLQKMIAKVPPNCQKIILIPHLFLHLLPLHAVPLSPTSQEYLIDRFPGGVSYAPSCQLLRYSQNQAQKLNQLPLSNSLLQREKIALSNLFAIQNPTNDLPFTNIEVETIASKFNPHQILKHHQATKANLTEPANYQSLNNSQWLHFSCHGYFNLISPLKSGLQLADAKIMNADEEKTAANYLRINEEEAIDLAKCLTLEDIFQLNLSNCRLVCLSACETGLIDFSNTSDEYIGLPSGFIKAGAVNIVSSLWSVSDFHTALLMMKFYENLANHPDDVPWALNYSQKWMKEANTTQILNWISQILDEINISEKQRIIDRLSRYYKPEEKPFDSPEYWAAFCAISPVYL